MRWVVFYAFAATILASVFSLHAFNSIMWIKFPDLYVEEFAVFPAFPDFSGMSAYGMFRTGSIFYDTIPLVMALLVISLSKAMVGKEFINEKVERGEITEYFGTCKRCIRRKKSVAVMSE